MRKKKQLSIIFIFLFISMILTACTSKTNGNMPSENKGDSKVISESKDVKESSTVNVTGELKVHFIDVGQADSILIQQDSYSMLIDGGNNNDDKTVKSYLDKQGIKELTYVMGTHAHEDHIGGLDYVINSFKVGKVYFPKTTATTKTFEDFILAVKNKGLQLTPPKVGDSFKLGDATCTILAPNSGSYEEGNNYSIVLKITYGSTSFLLTGDAEAVSEMEMVKAGLDLKADVIKIGHHGSKTSTVANFLDKVKPTYAVISVGKDNTYGHPNQSVMERLKGAGIKVYRTDENGTIVATSNGKEIRFDKNPGSYNYASADSGSNTGNSSSSGNTTKPSAPPPAEKPKDPTPPPTNNTNDRVVYYVPNGKSYHYSKGCSTLSRSKTILQGNLQDVINLGKSDPCDKCVR